MWKNSIFILLAIGSISCATTTNPDVAAWKKAVLRERSETLKCIRTICDNKMTVDHCLDLSESICQ